MPGTTRYSATFDRPYEEEEGPAPPPTGHGSRRSRSQSWQANVGMDARGLCGPLGHPRPSHRSSSTEGGAAKVEHIPTRTVSKTVVKTHNNPFQFVKVGSCQLYKKAEEQIKKAKEVKKPEVLKEEEEWQSNLESWKSKRRKMSEDVFRRQEEIRQFEQEEQSKQVTDKKTKTFSEMVESRAHRGRALSLCLISSPLDVQEWAKEKASNSSHPFSEGSEENSAVNSEDEGVSEKRAFQKHVWSHCTNGNDVQNIKNGNSTLTDESKQSEVSCTDSGLESISSSHRTGDTPDSCSDFSQDSGSSIDCDSPRVSGVLLSSTHLLEDYNTKETTKNGFHDPFHEMKIGSSDVNTQKNDSTTNCSVICDMSNKQQLSENGMRHSIESENEVFVDDFEELHAESKIFSHCASENTMAKVITEALTEKTPDLLKCKPNSCSIVKKSCDSQVERSALTEQPVINSTQSVVPDSQNSNDNSVKLKDNEKPKHRSKETDATESCAKREPKKIRRKKKAVAKIDSVEISNEAVAPPADQKKSALMEAGEVNLNIVYNSQPSLPKDSVSSTKSDTKVRATMSSEKGALNDVLPVEKVAEEMEKLILQQLEDEERAKEMSSKNSSVFGSPDHHLTAPPKVCEPPKEKPPPPPSPEKEVHKVTSLKRVNSTKRIKKEIHKRMSNFLGIENADESVISDECMVQPPPALEQILKAEMELDRESRKRLESEADLRLKLEECEMMEKEREIIASLETEERHRDLLYGEDVFDTLQEEERIQKLKEERSKIETEQAVAESQRLRLLEEQQLREREECIKKQEADIETTVENSASANLSSSATNPNASSLCPETKSLSGNSGEKGSVSNSVSQAVDSGVASVVSKSASEKPVVPPKPLKKKEAIRKERERLRQEQEALQREREQHRQRLLREQEEFSKSPPIPHAPIVSRLGPPPAPSYPPQLTHSMSSPPASTREPLLYASQGFQGAQGAASNLNGYVDPVSSKIKHKHVPSVKKSASSDQWNQKAPSPPKKPPRDPSPDSRYNQNHWLIQEAEMRRLADLSDRQRPPQTRLAEDDVCSPPPLLLNAPVQSKPWLSGRPPADKKPPSNSRTSDRPPARSGRVPPVPPAKPARVAVERPEHMLSVSGRKRCSHCSDELGRGAAMIIESLQLYYHIHCFQCCVCQAQLGNGSCGTDVRVRNNKLHCHNCYSNDEAGLKFSQV